MCSQGFLVSSFPGCQDGITPAVGSDPQDLCLRGGELLIGKDALVLEGGKLLDLFDLRALGGFGCGGFRCGGFIRWSGGRRGLVLVLVLVGRGAPLRGLCSHVGCGPGHDRGRRHSRNRSTSSERHVNRLLLCWRLRRRAIRRAWYGFVDLSRGLRPRRPWPVR